MQLIYLQKTINRPILKWTILDRLHYTPVHFGMKYLSIFPFPLHVWIGFISCNTAQGSNYSEKNDCLFEIRHIAPCACLWEHIAQINEEGDWEKIANEGKACERNIPP